MNDKSSGDDRSMNEILASIRKIVSDEEQSRKTIEEAPEGTGPEVFLLTGDMRADDAPNSPAAPVEPKAPPLGGAVDAGTAIGLSRLASALAPSSTTDAEPSPPSKGTDDATPSRSPGAPPPVDLDGGSEPLDLGLVPRAARKPDEASKPATESDAGAGSDAAPALTDDMEAMVRRIVREELQGPVGQQISRKVRALIREELARMKDDSEPLI